MKCYRLSEDKYALVPDQCECDAFAVNGEVFDGETTAVIAQRKLPIRVSLLSKADKVVGVVTRDGSPADISPEEYERRRVALERIVQEMDEGFDNYYIAMGEKVAFEMKYKPVVEPGFEVKGVLVIGQDAVIDRVRRDGPAGSRPYALAQGVEDERWSWVSLDLFKAVEGEARRLCMEYDGLLSCRVGYAHPSSQKVSLVSNVDGTVVWEQAIAEKIEGPESHVRSVFDGIVASMRSDAEQFCTRKRFAGKSALLGEIADALQVIQHGLQRAIDDPKRSRDALAHLSQKVEEMIRYVGKLQRDA